MYIHWHHSPRTNSRSFHKNASHQKLMHVNEMYETYSSRSIITHRQKVQRKGAIHPLSNVNDGHDKNSQKLCRWQNEKRQPRAFLLFKQFISRLMAREPSRSLQRKIVPLHPKTFILLAALADMIDAAAVLARGSLPPRSISLPPIQALDFTPIHGTQTPLHRPGNTTKAQTNVSAGNQGHGDGPFQAHDAPRRGRIESVRGLPREDVPIEATCRGIFRAVPSKESEHRGAMGVLTAVVDFCQV